MACRAQSYSVAGLQVGLWEKTFPANVVRRQSASVAARNTTIAVAQADELAP